MAIRTQWMRFGLVTALGMGATALAGSECKEEKPGLNARAKITCAQAEQTALAQVPGGKVKSSELEEEGGKLVFTFDIKAAKPGIEEVQVDAVTGAVVGVEHEDARAEAAERAQEAKQGAADRD